MYKLIHNKVVGKFLMILFLFSLVTLGFKPNSAKPAPQEAQSIPGSKIILRHEDRHIPFYVPPPEEAELGIQTANFVVNFNPDTCPADSISPWPAAAQNAFTFAANIWGAVINSNQTIEIDACWRSDLGPGILGSAGPTLVYRDFNNAPIAGSWYSVALANALENDDLNGDMAEIGANFSSAFNWYFGADGNTPATQVDFATVVLHEIGHGLGFLGFGNVDTGNNACGTNQAGDGCIRSGGFPSVYDRFTEDGNGGLLLSYTDPSTALGRALRGNVGGVFFDGTNANAANGGNRVRLYAPSNWSPGSSYSHLDEIFNNTPNALMTFSLGNGETIYNPGQVTLGILRDIGWGQERADLSITKSALPDPAIAGNNLTYTIQVTNNGPSNATNVRVTDTLPSGLELVSAPDCTGTTTLTCDVGNLANGATSGPIVITVKVPSSTSEGTTLMNTVEVIASQFDPNLNNNSTTESATVTRQVNLTISKFDSVDPVIAGMNLTYTIEVINNGPSDASGVEVTDSLPAGVTLASGNDCSNSCNLGNIPANETRTILIEVNVSSSTGDGTILTNTAQVTVNESDPSSGDNTTTEETTVIRESDLSISKSDSPDPLILGDNLTYAINVINNGPSDASGIQVTDTLPNDVLIVGGTCTPTPPTPETNPVTCDLIDLPSGISATVTIVVEPQPIIIVPDKTGIITNTASVAGIETDSTPINNTITEITTLIQLPEECNLDNANVIMGTPDNDRLIGTPGDDVIIGLNGADRISGRGGNDCIDGGGGRDNIRGGDGDDLIFGRDGHDSIRGNEGDDLILAGNGKDTLRGGAGDDVIFGDDGRDRLYGAAGNDLLIGGMGRDQLIGGRGSDQLFGQEENDLLKGGHEDDTLEGGLGRDCLFGNKGNDTLRGGEGDDCLYGYEGDDILEGGLGDDRLYGGSEADILLGNEGKDRIFGQGGNDKLDGGPDKDRLDGGGDDDVCANGEEVAHCEG